MIYVPGLCYHIIHDKKKEEKKKNPLPECSLTEDCLNKKYYVQIGNIIWILK